MTKFVWKAGTKGDWSDAANWKNGAVPTATDSAYIADAPYPVGCTVASSIAVRSVVLESGFLDFSDAGSCRISDNLTVGGAQAVVEGTDLTLGGTLTVGTYGIFEEDAQGQERQGAKVSVASIDNAGDLGVGGETARTELDVRGSASFGQAGRVEGEVSVVDDGLIAFTGTDQITMIDKGAELFLDGPNAVIADASDRTSNSALVGLATNEGTFNLGGGAEVTTAGRFTNNKLLQFGVYESNGSTDLSIGGALVNHRTIVFDVDQTRSAGQMSLSARSFDNRGGALTAYAYGGARDTMVVSGPASFGISGALEGDVDLEGDFTFEFSGARQITTIDKGARLHLDGTAHIVDTGIGLDGNTALTGLTRVEGSLELSNGDEIDTGRPLTVEAKASVELEGDGILKLAGRLSNAGDVSAYGGSQLEVGGALANEGTMSFGFLDGNGNGSLDVAGKIANTGTMTFQGDTKVSAVALEGAGAAIMAADSTLELDAAVSSQQFFHLTSNDTLDLSDAGAFHGGIHNFTHGDAYLFDAFSQSTTFNFAENAGHTGGVLTVGDGAHDAHIRMAGVYDNGDFALTAMQGGGVKISSTR